jgi:hypothetical protein
MKGGQWSVVRTRRLFHARDRLGKTSGRWPRAPAPQELPGLTPDRCAPAKAGERWEPTFKPRGKLSDMARMTVRSVVAGSTIVLSTCGSAMASSPPASTQSSQAAKAATSATAKTAGEKQLAELETDRPDITEGSGVVGTGIWQLETGVLFQSDRVDPVTSRDLSMPNGLLRVGVGSRLELRIGGEGFLAESISTPGTERTTGISDLELSLKYKFADQEHAGLDMAIIPLVSMPIGSDAFTTGGYDPTVKLSLARDLPRGFSIGGNVIVSSVTEDGTRFTQTSVTTSLSHALGHNWNGFWELYGANKLSRDGGRAWLFDTGVTHTFGENLQIDVSMGRGLTHDAPDWFIGAGFAIRGFFQR